MDSQALLERLVAFEEEVTYQQLPPAGHLPFRHQPGRLPILLSAPHGAAHRRHGRLKQEDEYTAAFARLLSERTGAHAFYTFARAEDDPNFDRHSPYKGALTELVAAHDIRFIIDLHGMSDRHKFGIAVGTMGGVSCSPRQQAAIFASLSSAGFRRAVAREVREYPSLQWDRYVVDHRRFTGGVINHTVTRFATGVLHIQAIQLELCAALRIVRQVGSRALVDDYQGDPAGIIRAFAALEEMVMKLV